MYNDQLKKELDKAKACGLKVRKAPKKRTKMFDKLGDALLAFYLNGGKQSRRIQDVMVRPGYAKKAICLHCQLGSRMVVCLSNEVA